MIVLTLFSIIEGCGLMGGVALIAFCDELEERQWLPCRRDCERHQASGRLMQVLAFSVARACLARVSSWRLAASCRFLLIDNYCRSVHGAS